MTARCVPWTLSAVRTHSTQFNIHMEQFQQQPYPPQTPPAPQPTAKPDNYLVWSILTTVLCCLPFGIVAIVKSSKVDSLWAQGQYAEAQKSANDAKMWSMISAGSCLVVLILYFLLIFIGAAIG